MTDTISQLLPLVQSETLFDDQLSARLANSATEISALQARLSTAGLGNLSNLLDDMDHDAIADLGTHIAGSTPDLISQMETFSTLSSLGQQPDVSTAFGPLLHGRGTLTAIDDINSMLDSAPDPSEITARVSQLVSIPAMVPDLISSSQTFFTDSQTNLAKSLQAAQIVSMFGTMPLKLVLGATGSQEMLSILKTGL